MKRVLGLITVCVIFITSCGSNSSTSNTSPLTPQVSVAITPSSQQGIDQGQTVNFTATVTNDSNSQGVTWSVSGSNCTGSACGTLTNTSTTAATYNAPASISSALTVTVTATSVVKNTVSASATVKVEPPPAISTTSLPNGTVGTSYSQTLAATGGTGNLTWNVASGSLPAGLTLNASTGAISGQPTTSGTSNFTVQVTDSAPTPLSAQQALSINVTQPTMTITTTSLPNGTVGVAYTGALQVNYATQPVTWSISSGTLPAGLALDPNTGAITGTPTAAGISSFTVLVTDSTTPTKQTDTQNLSITIATAGANNAVLKGNYAFLLSGYDASGNRVTVGGSFVADGSGIITSGTEDINAAASTPAPGLTFTGTYSVGTDNRGTITITNSATATYTMAIAMGTITSGVAYKGSILEFDNSGYTMSGTIELQDTTAFAASAITGSYVFNFEGSDSAGARMGVEGQLSANGSGGITTGVFDANDNSVVISGGAIANTSVYTVAPSTGRGTLTLSGVTPANYAIYVISASKSLVLSLDTASTNGLVAGEMDRQSGSFGATSLNGATVVGLESQAQNGPDVIVGIITFDGTGNATLAGDENNAGTVSPSTGTATYTTPDSTGRFTLTPTGSNHGLVGYLTTANQGFFLGTGSSVETGTFEKQSAGPFTNSSLSITAFFGDRPFATSPVAAPPGGSPGDLSIGVVTFDGAGNLSVTSDTNEMGNLMPDQTNTDTYTVGSNGRVTLGSASIILYLVSPTKVVTMSTNSNDPNPTLGFGRQ